MLISKRWYKDELFFQEADTIEESTSEHEHTSTSFEPYAEFELSKMIVDTDVYTRKIHGKENKKKQYAKGWGLT